MLLDVGCLTGRIRRCKPTGDESDLTACRADQTTEARRSQPREPANQSAAWRGVFFFVIWTK